MITPMKTSTYSNSLANIHLPDPDGKSARLGDFWHEARAVVVFLRHYG